MSSLVWGTHVTQSAGPSPSGDEVTSTVTVVDNNAPEAMQTTAPERGRLETDPDTEGGLTTRSLGSQVHPRVKPAVIDSALARGDHAVAMNREYADRGTAAEREKAGQWGHGTIYSQDGIERPALTTDGMQFTEDYFKAPERPLQADMRESLTPVQQMDGKTASDIVQTGRDNAAAASANPYAGLASALTEK